MQAAQFLAEHEGDLAQAAIATPTAGERFGLTTLAEDIGDNPNAMTRFVLVARSGSMPAPASTGADKTSIVADLPSVSAAVTVNVELPKAVGAPARTPVVELSVKPAGRVPTVTVYDRAPVPPVATTC